MQLFKVDLFRGGISLGDGGGQAGSRCGHAQHTAAIGHQPAIFGDGRAGVVHRDVFLPGQLAGEENITVYHSGTAITEDGRLVTNGGRVLGVTAAAPRLTAAITQAYAATEKIHFEKLHKRTDIGMRALKAIAEK